MTAATAVTPLGATEPTYGVISARADTLVDPMCGSGTFPIDGAHHNDVPDVGGKNYDKAIVEFLREK